MAVPRIRFAGPRLGRAVPVGPDQPAASFTGGWFNTTFIIPQEAKDQLARRAKAYPVPWKPADYKASWLVPTRLLLHPFIGGVKDNLAVKMYLNGSEAMLTKARDHIGRPSICTLLLTRTLTAVPPHRLTTAAGATYLGPSLGSTMTRQPCWQRPPSIWRSCSLPIRWLPVPFKQWSGKTSKPSRPSRLQAVEHE